MSLLGHVLADQSAEARHLGRDSVLAGPAAVDARLQRLDRLQRAAVDDGAADIADHVVGTRQAGVGEQRHHGFEAAAGDEGQADLGMAVDQPVELLAVRG